MSLQVWLPLNGSLKNQGLSNLIFSTISTNTSINTNGKIGQCYQNNSHSAGGLISNETINLGSQQSMFCWFKFTDLEAGSNLGGGLVSQHRYSSNQGMGITIRYVSSTTGYLSVNTGNGSSRTYNTYYGTTLLQANTWYHGGYTYDGQNIRIYINGHLEKIQAYANMAVPPDYLTVFCWSTSGTSGVGVHGDYKLNGYINDVRVYDHCLSQKEIEEIAKGLVLHYKLDSIGNRNGNPNLGNTSANYSNQQLENPYAASGWGGDAGTITYYMSGGYNNLPYKVYHKTATGSGGIYRKTDNDIIIEAGKTYTFSCWIKSSRNYTESAYGFNINRGSDNYYINYGASLVLTTDWKFFSKTFTATTDQAGAYGEMSIIYDDNVTDYYVYYSGFKVEEGTKATSWVNPKENNQSIVYDSSGYNNDGIIAGTLMVSENTSKYKYSTIFDGNTAAIQTPNLKTMITDKIYTISCWTYKTQIGSKNYQTIYGGPSGFELEARSSSTTSPLFRIHNWGGGTTPYEFGQWYHFCFVHTDDNSKLYINGELKITGTSTNIPSGNYFIGAWNTSSQQNYDGNISDFRIYATALTPEQILELYNTSASIDNNGNVYARELVEI